MNEEMFIDTNDGNVDVDELWLPHPSEPPDWLGLISMFTQQKDSLSKISVMNSKYLLLSRSRYKLGSSIHPNPKK